MRNRWFIAIKEKSENLFDLSGLQVIESPPNTYWADPFLASHEGKDYCFFEEYDYAKGRLAVAEIEKHDSCLFFTNPRVILDEAEHCSFPSVIKIHGEWYMTPERVLAGELLVYRAVQFPDVWTVHSRVAVGRYDDPIMRKNGEYYEVWATDDNKLRVFRTKDFGRWDVVRTEDKPYQRGAGHFIGDLRPTQDSVPIYGRAVKFLDPEGRIKHQIEPDWYPDLTGTHTFNVSERFVVIDGRIRL